VAHEFGAGRGGYPYVVDGALWAGSAWLAAARTRRRGRWTSGRQGDLLLVDTPLRDLDVGCRGEHAPKAPCASRARAIVGAQDDVGAASLHEACPYGLPPGACAVHGGGDDARAGWPAA
jgi:hypothetical protein